jgi:hypothetical protein
VLVGELMSAKDEAWKIEAERLRDEGWSYKQLSQKYGRSEGYIKKVLCKRRGQENIISADAQTLVKQEKEKVLADNQKRIMSQLIKEQAAKDIIAEKMISAINVLPPLNIKPIILPEKSSFREEEVVLLLSDIQAGTKILLEATGGLNEYNWSILEQQFEVLLKSITSITARMKKIVPIRKLNIAMLGDMVEGMGIFIGQAQHTDQDVYNQMFKLADLICWLLTELCYLFEEIEVTCIGGNHGRIGVKGENPHYVNHDVYLYKYIEAKLQNQKQIKFEIPQSWWKVISIKGWNFLLLHGDDIKQWNGIPYYAIDRADAKWTTLLSAYDIYFDYILMGHFHAQTELPRVKGEKIINGCWPGGSLFSLKSLVTSGRASQKLFGIHEEHGKTWSYNIFLDGGIRKQ